MFRAFTRGQLLHILRISPCTTTRCKYLLGANFTSLSLIKDVLTPFYLPRRMFNAGSILSVNIFRYEQRNVGSCWSRCYNSDNNHADDKKGTNGARYDPFFITLDKTCKPTLFFIPTVTHQRPFNHQIRKFSTEASNHQSTKYGNLFPTQKILKILKSIRVFLSDMQPLVSAICFVVLFLAMTERPTRKVELTSEHTESTDILQKNIALDDIQGMDEIKKELKNVTECLKNLQKIPENQCTVPVDIRTINASLDDVKGMREIKNELKQIVGSLKNSEKILEIGGKPTKGVLLKGGTGSGKTFIAQALAKEADVPFFWVNGTRDADLIYDTFRAAKEKTPCIIFVDDIGEVDDYQKAAENSYDGNKIIRNLICEMDLLKDEQILVLGATNNSHSTDEALRKFGRFEIEMCIEPLDFTDRKEILKLYLKTVKCDDIDLDLLATYTPGYTGSQLKNMVNIAALDAISENAEFVSTKHFENARCKVPDGYRNRNRIFDEKSKESAAYHEAGHAVVAHYTRDSEPVHKITILPCGPLLGYTELLLDNKRYSNSKSQLLADIDTALGGRAADELLLGPNGTNDSSRSDLRKATKTAVEMVKMYGMSEKVGLRSFDFDDNESSGKYGIGVNTQEAIDQEINKILHDSYERAKTILKKYAKEHKLLAEALLKNETLYADDVEVILGPRPSCDKQC